MNTFKLKGVFKKMIIPLIILLLGIAIVLLIMYSESPSTPETSETLDSEVGTFDSESNTNTSKSEQSELTSDLPSEDDGSIKSEAVAVLQELIPKAADATRFMFNPDYCHFLNLSENDNRIVLGGENRYFPLKEAVYNSETAKSNLFKGKPVENAKDLKKALCLVYTEELVDKIIDELGVYGNKVGTLKEIDGELYICLDIISVKTGIDAIWYYDTMQVSKNAEDQWNLIIESEIKEGPGSDEGRVAYELQLKKIDGQWRLNSVTIDLVNAGEDPMLRKTRFSLSNP